jgi:hypothetical protein
MSVSTEASVSTAPRNVCSGAGAVADDEAGSRTALVVAVRHEATESDPGCICGGHGAGFSVRARSDNKCRTNSSVFIEE